MADPRGQMVNPMLALAQLYQKDGKCFVNVIDDIIGQLNTIGMDLSLAYVNKEVLPWIYSLLFMTAAHQMLDEYVAKLTQIDPRKPPPGKTQSPAPANL